MQKFNPSKGYWRITPQNRFYIVKDIGEKNIVIFKKIETRKLWSQLNKVRFCKNMPKYFFTFHDNKVRFCSVFEKKFFYLLRLQKIFFYLLDTL
jgi:hypothetical protein